MLPTRRGTSPSRGADGRADVPQYPLVEMTTPERPARYSASLLAWGRHPRSGWWGLVTWQHAVREPGSFSTVVSVAAWVPAGWLKRAHHSTSTEHTPLHQLGDDHLSWPEQLPPWFGGTYLGVWAGGSLPLPDGEESATPEPVERYETSI